MLVQNSLKERVYQIDLFRFIAALSVLLYHYLFRGYAADGRTTLDVTEAGSYFKYGFLGVHWFFIISGFVIALSAQGQSLRNFLTARFIRLYPAYWAGVVLTFTTILFFGAPQFTATFSQFVVNLSMFQSLFGVEHVDGVYWSLVVELKFYILVAGFLVVRRFFREVAPEPFVICWLALTIVYVFHRESAFIQIVNYFLFLDYSALFIAGITFFRIFEKGVNVSRLLVIVVCLAASVIREIDHSAELGRYYDTEFSPYAISALLIFFFALVFLVSARRLNVISSPGLLHVGALTYPLYLIHQKIGFILFINLGEYFNRYVLFVLITVFIIIISYLIHKAIEKPGANFLRSKFNSPNKALVSAG